MKRGELRVGSGDAPRTNAQIYREQMATDEGLAEFLMAAHDCEIHIPFCRSDVVCTGEDDPKSEACKACMMAWLQQIAEVRP